MAVGVVFAAYLPLLWLHGQTLWQKPHYQFFPLVIVGALALAANRWQGMGALNPGAPSIVYPSAILMLLSLTAAALFDSPWVGAVAWLAAILAVLYGIGGATLLYRMLPAWALLWLAIPIPLDYDRKLITALQLFTAKWSSVVLDMLRITHVMQGAVVEVPEKRLLVEEACSGIHSLFATLCCTLFFIFWSRIPLVRGVLLMVSAVFWVIVANVARVVVVTIVDTKLKINVTEGLPHEMVSFIIFAVILGLVFSTDRLLLFLTPRRLVRSTPDVDHGTTALPDVRKTWLGSYPLAGAFAALALIQFIVFLPSSADALTIPRMAEESLPPKCVGCERTRYEIQERTDQKMVDEGQFSQRWIYQLGRNVAMVSLDYPFHGYHDLSICYRNSGWQVSNPKPITVTDARGAEQTLQEQSMTMLDLQGYLLFGVYDTTGKSLNPVSDDIRRRLARGMVRFERVLKLLGMKSASQTLAGPTGPTYQIQLLVQSYTPLTEQEKQQAQSLFQQTEAALRQQIESGRGGQP